MVHLDSTPFLGPDLDGTSDFPLPVPSGPTFRAEVSVVEVLKGGGHRTTRSDPPQSTIRSSSALKVYLFREIFVTPTATLSGEFSVVLSTFYTIFSKLFK